MRIQILDLPEGFDCGEQRLRIHAAEALKRGLRLSWQNKQQEPLSKRAVSSARNFWVTLIFVRVSEPASCRFGQLKRTEPSVCAVLPSNLLATRQTARRSRKAKACVGLRLAFVLLPGITICYLCACFAEQPMIAAGRVAERCHLIALIRSRPYERRPGLADKR